MARSCPDPGWRDHCGDDWRAHVLATTGRDICDVVGPSPRSARDWAAMMRRLGVRGMAGVISAVHGVPIPVRQARRGDVVRRGWAIGVCRGDLAVFFGGTTAPMREVDQAWRLFVPNADWRRDGKALAGAKAVGDDVFKPGHGAPVSLAGETEQDPLLRCGRKAGPSELVDIDTIACGTRPDQVLPLRAGQQTGALLQALG